MSSSLAILPFSWGQRDHPTAVRWKGFNHAASDRRPGVKRLAESVKPTNPWCPTVLGWFAEGFVQRLLLLAVYEPNSGGAETTHRSLEPTAHACQSKGDLHTSVRRL